MARTRAGFKREADAAKAIGCSRTLVIRWETDAQSIGQKYLLPAARAYQVRAEWLAMQSDDDGFPCGDSASKTLRSAEFDASIVSDLAWNLQEAFKEEFGRPYDLAAQPELFVGAYKIAASGKAHDMRKAMLWLGKKLNELAEQECATGGGNG